jgi:molecular chaperone DnaK
MARPSIDFGIDLGTTNSAIALLKEGNVQVIRNRDDVECTPSAVWINEYNQLFVGREAKDRFENDSQNAFCEFKLQMGTDTQYQFGRSGRRMNPEELSSEVLKSMKADVKQRIGEDVQAAVITVPAAFELPQCDATRRAAQLAGFVISPLLQEPVAAALAYGFKSEGDKVFWLVYDLGGGTFDAAVMQLRDSVIQVVNHGGDNQLGGKLIDWAIVDELLIPVVTKQYRLTDFRRGNPKYREAIGKLKYWAELAKIQVSRTDSSHIEIGFLCNDDRNNPVRFDYDLKRADVERLTEPFIRRSINICKRVLEEKRLNLANIEKMLLVGGPTLMPYLKERLTDRQHGLGIPLEFSIDPMTVVTQGAAIFAGTQRIDIKPVAVGKYTIDLEYQLIGADTEPVVGGKVVAWDEGGLSGFMIEIINSESRPPWRSGRLALAPNGAFETSVRAEKNRQNTFMIELYDKKGTKRPTVPDRFTYMFGVTTSETTLIHSVGIALANNEVQCFFEKGTALRARRRNVHRIAFDTRSGLAENLIRIPVIEGENKRADRNRLIGFLEIPASKIKRDVPAGSEIEITIEIDESRLVRTKAYIPMLNEEYEEVVRLKKEAPDPDLLQAEIEAEKRRLADLRWQVEETGDASAQQILTRVSEERIEQDLDASLAASRVDNDAADKCKNRLLDLQLAIDEIEQALEWPLLMARAKDEINSAAGIVRSSGNSTDKQRMAALERETRQAMDARDAHLLQRKISELIGLAFRVQKEDPRFWIDVFHDLEERRQTMQDPEQAEQWIDQGTRAMHNNDLTSLQAAVQQLIALLPSDQRQDVRKGFGSTVR